MYNVRMYLFFMSYEPSKMVAPIYCVAVLRSSTPNRFSENNLQLKPYLSSNDFKEAVCLTAEPRECNIDNINYSTVAITT